jgi:transposase
LKPVIRRVWAKRGQRPSAVAQPRYKWLYLYAFVHPTSGAVEWFTGSTVDTALFSAVLARFAAAIGAGPHKRVLLVLDGAGSRRCPATPAASRCAATAKGWHVSADLVVPEGIRLVFLPPSTPELQPAEHLWPLTNEAVANQHFATLADLGRALATRCRVLTAQPDILRANTLFHWWPKAA